MMNTNFGPLVGLKMNGGGFVRGYADGGGKVDMARRGILGLSRLFAPKVSENLPAVIPGAPQAQAQKSPLAAIAPAAKATPVPAPAPNAVSPLTQLVQKAAETPMTRRDVLKRAGQVAVNQVLPTPSITDVVPEIAATVAPIAQVAKSAIPAIDEAAAAAKIAAYAGKIWQSTAKAKKAIKASTGGKLSDIWDDPTDVPLSELWGAVEYGDEPDFVKAAKAAGLDLETVAAKTGIPLDVVQKLSGGDAGLINRLIDISGSRTGLEGILEDGRSKEARRSTSYVDLWGDNEFLDATAKKVIQELGPDADTFDIADAFDNELVGRWRAMERGNQKYDEKSGYSLYAPDEDKIRSSLTSAIIDDDILDDIWGQAVDDGTYHHEDVLGVLSRNGWKGLDEEE